MKRFAAAIRVTLACWFVSSLSVVCRTDGERLFPNAPSVAAERLPTPGMNFPLQTSDPAAQNTARPQMASQTAKPELAGWSEHGFWDRENLALFAAVGGSRALDYSSTLNMRRRGRQEIFLTNDNVDNHAAFAAIEAGGTAVSIATSYLFHRYRHYRLERWTSIVHASLSTSGAVRNYCLKTVHPSTSP